MSTYTTIEELYKLFESNDKPSETDFKKLIDSFFHKSEKLEPEQIEGLANLFLAKVDSSSFDAAVQSLQTAIAALQSGEATRSFVNLAAATAEWTALDGTGNTPTDGVTLFIEDEKIIRKWDSTQSSKVSVWGKDYVDLELINDELYRKTEVDLVWHEFGLASSGAIETSGSQSHTDLVNVKIGDRLTFTQSVFRINFYRDNDTFISQGGFAGGTEFTIPDTLTGVAKMRVESNTSYDSNTTDLTIRTSFIKENQDKGSFLEANQDEIIRIVKEIRSLSPTWNQYGLASSGVVNSTSYHSHTDFIDVEPGELLKASATMFRINLYRDDESFISQGGFTGGLEFTIPEGCAKIKVSSELAHTVNQTTLTLSKNNIESIQIRLDKLEADVSNFSSSSYQDFIVADNATNIDFTNYLVNGSVNISTGAIDLSSSRRSIEKFPLETTKKYKVINSSDVASGKKVAIFDSNETLLRVLDIVNMEFWEFVPEVDDAFISITLVSALGSTAEFDKVKLYSFTSEELQIEKINGIPLAGQASSGTDKIEQVVANGSALPKSNGTVTLPEATPAQDGLMSKEDKAKLDGVATSPINITGSGVTKNASSFGYLPTATAEENMTALQNAINGGGFILVDVPGVYDHNKTITVPSNTFIWYLHGCYVNKVSFNGNSPKYTFINEGASSKTWNENIRVKGLNIITNGIGNGNHGTNIYGLRGQIAFHYIKNLVIEDFTCLDVEPASYCVHICTFQNIKVLNTHIEGDKDAIHLGKGKDFVIRDGYFKTYDDPIALNGHDYATGNPELGWIENGIIENCYDLADITTTGFFARILAGAWVDWFNGMEIQNSDTVIHGGRMYRAFNSADGTTYTSNTAPTHTSGTVTHDGINWAMIQENDVTYSAGVRNVTFRNIYLQKDRPIAFSIHFDKDNFSRSYYPNAVSPIQEDLVFDNIVMQGNVPELIRCKTPINTIKVVNSTLRNNKIYLDNINTAGIAYGKTNILLLGTTFKGTGSQDLVQADTGYDVDVKIAGSIKEHNTYDPQFVNVSNIISSDL